MTLPTSLSAASYQFSVSEFFGFENTQVRYACLQRPREDQTIPMTSCQKVLIFIPGLGGSVKGALDFLAHLLPHYDVIYGLDLRGFGLNQDLPLVNVRRSYEDIEGFIESVVTAMPSSGLNPHGQIDIASISLGSVLATHLTYHHAPWFRRSLLIAPAFKPHPAMFPLPYVLKNVWGQITRGPSFPVTLPYDIKALTLNPEILNDPQYQNPPLTVNAGYLLSVRSLSLQAIKLAKALTVPTMIMVPGLDLVCDPHAMRDAYYGLPVETEKKLVEYPQQYHDLLLEKERGEVAETARDWFAI